MDRRNTQVSYHALALFKITVSIFKDRHEPRRPANRCNAIPDRAEGTIGHRSATMELMGIEPTTSGLQNRRSPS